MIIQITTRQSSLGNVLIASTAIGVCAVSFSWEDLLSNWNSINIEKYDNSRDDIINKTLSIIDGKNDKVPIHIYGTDFQESVWSAILDIPYGETLSYKELGERIDCKAYRAIGTACGQNPVAILVPCHRVIGSNGELGGYRWGIEIKKRLLDREANAKNLCYK